MTSVDDLGLPQGGFGLGHETHAVALRAQQLLDRGVTDPETDLGLGHVGVGQLLVADAVVGSRRDGAGRLADVHEQLDRHAGPLRQLRECDATERREPFECRGVEEVERDLAGADGGPRPSSGMPEAARPPTNAARRR
jgi:hypothetical protein